MVEEIVYTSAEKGLKQGSRGFCTVVSTAGMSLALAERLESMSGYRHAFPLHYPQASMNPVCFSHVTTRLAGKSLHVISRVADAGQDYTGRSNKLAHHLVIDNVASMPAGPARLMAEPGVIVERWDGNVRNIPPRELRCAPLPSSIPLVAWQSLTGDEGWAGAVAEQLLQNPAPVSIIFKPGTDTLTLVREVLDLIPAPQRWNVTFSTYFTRLLAGAECQLRFVLNDTPEATSLRNDARARVIDLTSSLPAATGGTLVAVARKGQLTPHESAPTPAAQAVRSRTAAEIPIKDAVAEVAIPKPKPSLSPPETQDKPQHKPQPPRDVPPPVRENSRRGLWIGLTAAVVLITVTGILIVQQSGKKHDPFAELVSQNVPKDKLPTEAEKEAQRQREQLEQELRDREEREREEKLAADEAAKNKASEEKMAADKLAREQETKRRDMEAKDAQAKAARDAKMQDDGPFVIIKNDFKDERGQLLFKLPRPGDTYTEDKWPQIRSEDNRIILSLCEAASPLFSACPYTLNIKRDETIPNAWIVEAAQTNTVIQIARYKLITPPRGVESNGQLDTELQFEWLRDATRETGASELLRWWPLEISVSNRTAVLLQRSPEVPLTVAGRPTWHGLVQSKPIDLIRTPAIDAVPFHRAPGIDFSLELAQKETPTQLMTVKVTSDETAETQSQDADEPESEKYKRYFQLSVPLKLEQDTPTAAKTPLGFGEIQLSVSQGQSNGLRINPQVDMTLRLPSKEFTADLPDIKVNDFLNQIIETPIAIQQFNPMLKEAAIEASDKNFDIFNRDVSRWHQQKLQPLPSLAEFRKAAFVKLKDRAIKSIKDSIGKSTARFKRASDSHRAITPQMRAAAVSFPKQQAAIASADLEFKAADAEMSFVAKELEPKASAFVDAMGIMERNVQDSMGKLVTEQQHAAISIQLDMFDPKKADISIRCTLSGTVRTPGSENGDSLRIYFVESVSENWTGTEHTAEAK